AQPRRPQPPLARGVRTADQARAAQGGAPHPLRGIRDPESVRDRIRARSSRALPKPAIRGRSEMNEHCAKNARFGALKRPLQRSLWTKPDCYAWLSPVSLERAGGAICRYEQVF